ncbi:MAG: hypothetical protein MZV63_41220 [Marinilabiliales bacterium]|nr:hypothetical protein [Marinilabiliales bacterium]
MPHSSSYVCHRTSSLTPTASEASADPANDQVDRPGDGCIFLQSSSLTILSSAL